MRLLLMCIILVALLQWIKAEENATEVGFPAPEAQTAKFSKRENDTGEPGTKLENETKSQQVLPIRCLGCVHYCNSYEDGKDENGKGNRLCQIELGVLHGCVSIFQFGLKRMCITEMSLEDKIYCKENANLCIKCHESDCNYVNLTVNGLQANGSPTFKAPLIWLLGTCLIAGLVRNE